MFRWFLLALLTLAVAALSAVRSTPIEFAMSQVGLPNGLVDWTSAEGTITKGRLNTVTLGPQLIGDVLVTQRSLNPFSRSISYDVQWGSAGGRGSGQIVASPERVQVKELRLQQNIVAMPGLVQAIRELGGSIRILNGSFDIDQNGCNSAEGEIFTDLLMRLGNQYGRSFSELKGPVSCENGNVMISLSASSAEGDLIEIAGNVSAAGAGEFNISVTTFDSEIRLVLQEYGFTKSDDDVWRYRYQT